MRHGRRAAGSLWLLWLAIVIACVVMGLLILYVNSPVPQ